jgi:hypothetical protein
VSHRYRKSPPSTRMYRHFAVVTLAVTGMLAVFAEGENAAALTEQAEERLPQKEAPDAPTTAMPTIQQPGGVWGSDLGLSFDTPTIPGGGASELSASWWPELSRRGYSPDYLVRLSEEERRSLEAAMSENLGSSPGEAATQLARLEAASRARSGSTGRD